MIVGRIAGWLVLTSALLAGAAELAAWVDTGVYDMLSVGQLWSDIHPGSFNSAQVWVEHDEYLGLPWLWDPGFATALALPAWPLLALVGGLMLYSFRWGS